MNTSQHTATLLVSAILTLLVPATPPATPTATTTATTAVAATVTLASSQAPGGAPAPGSPEFFECYDRFHEWVSVCQYQWRMCMLGLGPEHLSFPPVEGECDAIHSECAFHAYLELQECLAGR